MRSIERTFSEWLLQYNASPNMSEERNEALDQMLLTASFHEEWTELLRIGVNCQNFPLHHPFLRICTDGVCFTEPSETHSGPGIFEHIKSFFKLSFA